ncbi:MAG TPA: cytochrome c-type biogenesis protein [Actinomycetota bacterium]|nr:cytochrome c-type biogenesis protein [Actinomycetota bacterium]
MKFLILGATALALVLLPATAFAAAEDQANDLSNEIMSPFCPGVTLHECPSPEAIALRNEIVDWFSQGKTRAEIMSRLEDEYGPQILAAPPAEGAGLGAWLLPAAALVAGIALSVFLLRRWTRAAASDDVEDVLAPAERRRVDSELAALRGPR